MKPDTLKDVAKQLNLSVSTVSRVVNGKSCVKQETRQRVLDCLAASNYVPNEIARSLKAQESMTIGVIVPDLREGYIGRIIKEIDAMVSKAGYILLVADTNENRVTERRYLDLMFQKRVDALVISSVDMDSPNVSRYLASGIPVVFIDNKPQAVDERLHYVLLDNHQASRLAVQTLADHGHRNIALIVGSPEESTGYERQEGFCRALEDCCLPLNRELILHGNFKADGGYDCMRKLLQRKEQHPFTAVHVTSEMMTIGALRAIREANLEVGKDISLIGFDVHDELGLATPTIAAVRQPEALVGRTVGRILLQLLQPKKYGCATNTRIWLKATLQHGNSIQVRHEHAMSCKTQFQLLDK